MDIARLSMNMSSNRLLERVGIAVMKQQMDIGEVLSQELVEMIDSAAMERSVNPAVGGNVDMRI